MNDRERELAVVKHKLEMALGRANRAEEQLTAERDRSDALAAHVEAWRNAMMNAIKSRGDMRQLMALVHANPKTRLAQRDARVAAEALEEAARMAAVDASLRCIDDNGNWLRELANDWRRNAEGGEL